MSNNQDLTVKGTRKTPQIRFNHQSGELVLTGRSVPENATNFYELLLRWIKVYIKSPYHTTNLHIKLEYFNVASLRWIAMLIKELSKITLAKASLFIHLYFDAEDYNSNDSEDLREIFNSLISSKHLKVRIGIKTYGVIKNWEITKVSAILI